MGTVAGCGPSKKRAAAAGLAGLIPVGQAALSFTQSQLPAQRGRAISGERRPAKEAGMGRHGAVRRWVRPVTQKGACDGET